MSPAPGPAQALLLLLLMADEVMSVMAYTGADHIDLMSMMANRIGTVPQNSSQVCVQTRIHVLFRDYIF